MNAKMAELGHADLIDPDDVDGPDEPVDADLAWGPGVESGSFGGVAPASGVQRPTTGRRWLNGELVTFPLVEAVDVPADAELADFFARQRVSRAAQKVLAERRRTWRPPAPEVLATALTRAQVVERGASAAVLLWDAAAGAGWTVSATYARGPLSTEKTLCSSCLTWQEITKAGILGVHGPRADRCSQRDPDPDSPTARIVDSIIVRAASRRGDRLAACWVDDGDAPGRAQYGLDEARLWHPGDRPRKCGVVAVRGVLKEIAAARKPKRAARKRRAKGAST